MAVLGQNTVNKTQEEQDKELNLGGGGSSVGGAMGMGAPVAPASSGKFTNVQKYIGANKDAGGRIAGSIGQRVGNQINKAESLANNVSAYRSNIDAETGRLGQGSLFADEVKADPTKITSDADRLSAFSALYNPSDISQKQQAEFGQLGSKAATGLMGASEKVANLGSESGRFNLLRETLGRPNYTSGQQRLDQALFQVGGAQQLANIQKDQSNRVLAANTNLTNTQDTLGNLINENIRNTGEVSQNLRGTVSSEDTSLVNAQAAEATRLAEQRKLQNEAIQKFFSGGVDSLTKLKDTTGQDFDQKKFIEDQLKAGNLGFDSRTYNVLGGDNSKNYITQGNVNLSSKDVVDAQELARYNALLTLAERDPSSALFTGVGDSGPSSGIKSTNLATDIQGARTGMENRFRDEILRGQAVDDRTHQVAAKFGPYGSYTPGYTGGEKWTVDSSQQALNLLNDLEAKRNAQINAATVRDYYTQAGPLRSDFGTVQVGVNSAGQGTASGINAPETANAAAAQVWQQFMQRLEQEGYNNTLGKITPR